MAILGLFTYLFIGPAHRQTRFLGGLNVIFILLFTYTNKKMNADCWNRLQKRYFYKCQCINAVSMHVLGVKISAKNKTSKL